jgi:hypothetical protein
MMNTKQNIEVGKSWREYTVPDVGLNNVIDFRFIEIQPNYVLITNPCPNNLYVSLTPTVNANNADLVVPAYGQKIFARPLPINQLYFFCVDEDTHVVNLASWVQDFDAKIISQTQETIDTSLADQREVTVTNFPPSTQVSNFPTAFGVNNFPTQFGINNFPTQFNIGNFPANQPVTVLNPYKPLELKESFSDTASQTKTFGSARKGVWVKNDGSADMTVTINGLTSTIKVGEALDERYADFTTMDIAATGAYRVRVRG